MDPAIENIILGIVANVLTAVFAHIGHKGREMLKHEDSLRQLLKENTALTPILQKATASVARSAKLGKEHQVERLRMFLASSDVDAIVRQIYASQLTTAKNGNYLESIRDEFMACLSLHFNEPQESLKELAGQLFDALLMGCEQALRIAVDKGVLSAHEAESAFRHRILLDELAAIQKNLGFLTSLRKPNLREILEFEKKYRYQVADRHGYIIPPHFDAAKKLSIDELYVCPNFEKTPNKKDEESQVLEMLDFLSVLYRAVVLGDPGGGKSTFASKLCHDLVTRYSERLFAGRQVTPILVVLRDYGVEKKVRNCSILQFIEATANSKYQVQPPPSAFEYLLLNGRAMVIFDGLDELLDTSYRQEISSDVESFCTLYPSVPVLVTSRKVGYEQAPLDNKRFEIFRLSPFNNDQVRDYVTKWFATDSELMPCQQKQKAIAFLEESQIVPDLRSNPLILALLCNIYRGENYIPQNRPDVYEKCALMLFERWDKTRGIHITLPIEAHIRPAMMYLAHWIYTNDTLQGGVTEKSLTEKATEYLCPRRFENRDEAEKAACEFIEFCRGRAWVFTDTGTTKEGERLYQFTHRTFLEYFTAAHLARTHETTDELGGVLRPRIAKGEWDVVTQLAFQIKNRSSEDAGDKLLTALTNEARETEGKEGWNLLSFAIRYLEFMVPSPKVIRDITTSCIERCLAWGSKRMQYGKALHDREVKYHLSIEPEVLGDLLNAAIENRATIADNLEKLLVERIKDSREPESVLASEIGLHLTLFLVRLERSEGRLTHDSLDFWARISDCILNACSDQIEAFYPKHLRPCLDAFWQGKVSITNLLKWHGFEAFFYESRYIMFPNTWSFSPAVSLISTVISAPYLQESKKRHLGNDLAKLEEAGCVLLSYPPPWIIQQQTNFRERPIDRFKMPPWMFDETRYQREIVTEPLNLSSDSLFGAFVLFAVLLEATGEKQNIYLNFIKTTTAHFFNSLRWIFLSRFMHLKRAEEDKVQAEMDLCGFTTEQQSFAWQWIRKEISLVQWMPQNNEKDRDDLSEEVEEP